MQVEIGRAHPDELRFVFSSWKHSALDAPQNDKHKQSGMVGEYFTRANAEVQAAMDSKPLVLVAREATDSGFIYSWMAVGLYPERTLALLYGYTKYKFRRLGIMRDLRDRMLELVPDDAQLVYCAKSVHDEIWEGWGFSYQPLEDVLGVVDVRRARRRA